MPRVGAAGTSSHGLPAAAVHHTEPAYPSFGVDANLLFDIRGSSLLGP